VRPPTVSATAAEFFRVEQGTREGGRLNAASSWDHLLWKGFLKTRGTRLSGRTAKDLQPIFRHQA